MRTKLLYLLFMGFFFSCSVDKPKLFPELGNFSGEYKFYHVSSGDPAIYCVFNVNFEDRPAAIEISPNGRFTILKKYLPNVDNYNYCDETDVAIEGQITFTESFFGRQLGTIEYDDSEIIDGISFDESINGVHYEFNISPTTTGTQYYYKRD